MTCQAHSTLGAPSSFIPSISSALCCCYTFHLMDRTPPPPHTAAALTSVYHANTLPMDVDPSAFYTTVCCVFVCPSAPRQLRGPVSFPIFQPTTGWVGPSSGLLPRYTPKGCGHITLPAPFPLLWLITARQSAMRPCPSVMPAPSGRRLDGDHARISAHVKLHLSIASDPRRMASTSGPPECIGLVTNV